MAQLEPRVGQRLKSQVDATEVIVVRAQSAAAALTCGGQPLVDVDTAAGEPLVAEPLLMTGSLLGKRYTTQDGALELLVTKAGNGTLALGTEPLVAKSPRPLPSSD